MLSQGAGPSPTLEQPEQPVGGLLPRPSGQNRLPTGLAIESENSAFRYSYRVVLYSERAGYRLLLPWSGPGVVFIFVLAGLPPWSVQPIGGLLPRAVGSESLAADYS